jgi:predicted LPLAT superfamily acyltransferase
VSSPAGWARVPERGSVLAMRLVVWVYRILGPRAAGLLALPATIYFLLTDRRGRAASRRYLDHLYTRPEGRAALRRRPDVLDSFRHYRAFALNILDRVGFWAGDRHRFRFVLHGREHLERLAGTRRGALILSAHLGSFDALRMLADESGIPLRVVMYTRHARMINSVFSRLNAAADLHIISLDPAAPVRSAVEIKTAMERGDLVGILGDRVSPEDSDRVWRVPFLGRSAPFPQGPFRLAATLRCPMLLMLGIRTDATTYDVVVEPLMDGASVPAEARDETLMAVTQAYARRLEAFCFRAPYQWFNFFDFWGEEAASIPTLATGDPLNAGVLGRDRP